WGRDKILSDVVWVIRKFKPDVIITRFPGDNRAGHGHHWASALLANEAFIAAADPSKFPEQLKYVSTWQAKRILWNSFIPAGNAVPDSVFRVNVGVYNPILGKGFGEIASESRSNHKSQGFGAARTRGDTYEYFITTGGEKPVNDLMDGVSTAWDRVEAPFLQAQVAQIAKHFTFEKPETSLADLVLLYQTLTSLPAGYWKEQKLKETQLLIEAAAGIFADVTAPASTVVQGDSLRMNFVLNKRNAGQVIAKKVSIEGFDFMRGDTLVTNRNYSFSKSIPVPSHKKITQPYWLEHGMPNGCFDVRDQELIGKAENDAAFSVIYTMSIAGEEFRITRPVQYKFTDPVKGEVYEPVVVLPKVLVSADPGFILISKTTRNQFTAKVKVLGDLDSTQYLVLSRKTADKDDPMDIAVFEKGTTLSFNYTPSLPLSGDIRLYAKQGPAAYDKDLMEISYDHIPLIRYFKPSVIKPVTASIVTTGKKVGYIAGAGDAMPEALKQMGYSVVLLDEHSITAANLKSLDAIITGIRAYNIHSWLSGKYDVLMNYVKDGGNLIVQFNTNNQVGPVRAKIGPYPFNISRTRVSEEDAKVEFLLPKHPVVNIPNKITPEDFTGWVQERSVYEADQVDSSFVMPLGMNDKGEKLGKGSLIIARHGKGNFVYTGLALFRQLPAGATGAYKLLANLVALPKNK
ncbi:MAG: family deacetylase, partial [Chitinophagaceae bacterium]|nr:family deacetylase [Chitinophagaceae bacterium]